MAYLFDNIPLMRCHVRGEYLQDLAAGHGQFFEGIAHAVRCRRGASLWFQVNFKEPLGGVSYLLPIEALTWRADAAPARADTVQPWDCMGDHFAICELRFLARGGVQVLPDRTPGQYRFSIDFGGEDLADDPAQHKTLHIVWRKDGAVGAYPNNRLLWEDAAFWDVIDSPPAITSLLYEARAEGMQSLINERRHVVKEAAE